LEEGVKVGVLNFKKMFHWIMLSQRRQIMGALKQGAPKLTLIALGVG